MPRRYVPLFVPLLCAGALLAAGCEQLADLTSPVQSADTTRAPGVPPPGEGLVTTATGGSVQAVADRLKGAIQSSGATLVADIDHARNAPGSDSLGGLRPTRLLIFGTPRLGTPLMQNVHSTGIDLPHKVLVWQGADDSTRITYNEPAYLEARHDLSGQRVPLRRMRGTLARLVGGVAGRTPDTLRFTADSIAAGAGLAVTASDFGVGETFRRLQGAVQARAPLSVMTTVNHARNANGVAGGDSLAPSSPGREQNGGQQQNGSAQQSSLRPMRLLLFGNPAAGTPLMRQAPTMGIDLPQKMLVYENGDGDTFVVHNEPAYLADRHEVADTAGLSKIASMLHRLAFEATSDQAERRQLEEAREDTTGVAF